MAQRKVFTVDEAAALLPHLRPLLQRGRDLYLQLRETERALTQLHWKSRTNGRDLPDDSLERVLQELASQREALEQIVDSIQSLGVEIKDLETGLVDFPSHREGRLAYLCWRMDEPTIAYWHELDAGFRGRKPLWN